MLLATRVTASSGAFRSWLRAMFPSPGGRDYRPRRCCRAGLAPLLFHAGRDIGRGSRASPTLLKSPGTAVAPGATLVPTVPKARSHVSAAEAPVGTGGAPRLQGIGGKARRSPRFASAKRGVFIRLSVEYVPGGAGQTVASCASMPRKVRAPQGTVPGNAWAARADGKCNRKIPPAVRGAGRTQVRQRAPASPKGEAGSGQG